MGKLRIFLGGLAMAIGACPAAIAANATVNIVNYTFVDGVSGIATTNINQGDTVTWHFTNNTGHSTTSGTCSSGGGGAYGSGPYCTSDGIWDSGIVYTQGANYPHVFSTAGTFHYFCEVHGASMGMQGTIVVAAASGCSTISLAPAALPGGLENIAYNNTVTASGGTAPYTFAVTSGSPPPGVNINASTGALSGSPTATGTFTFTITATDSHECTGALGYSVTVSGSSTPGDVTVIPGVGSLPGAFGSIFRTQLQLTNGSGSAIAGNIVFHPAGASASPSDPSMSYLLESWQTINFNDLLPAMGQSGVGSADLVPTSGSAPTAVARIYNDGGAAGTTGFSEPTFRASDALQTGDNAVFVLPFDSVNYRFNLGVRTLGDGVTVAFTIWDASGTLVGTATKSFPANFFTQATGAQFLGLVSLPTTGSIGITVTQGSAIFFAPTVDNRTQDSSTQFTRHGG